MDSRTSVNRQMAFALKCSQGKESFWFSGFLLRQMAKPALRARQGENAGISIIRKIDAEIGFHWHGPVNSSLEKLLERQLFIIFIKLLRNLLLFHSISNGASESVA